ncbi:MAG TPA: FAD-binding protein, partial [Verrucomicrobiae bacterium]
MTPTADILENPMRIEKNIADKIAGRVSSATVIRRDELLAKHTTLRVGGPADVYVEPATEDDLASVVKFCSENEIKFFILGRGSNLLVRDGGFRGVVICLAQPEFSKIEIRGERIFCGVGAKLKNVSVEAKRNNLSGVEFLEGIPGSVGGALRMNAGAMGGATFDVVESVRVMDFGGNIFEMTPKEMSVDYRSCAALKNHIALGAVFKCKTLPR